MVARYSCSSICVREITNLGFTALHFAASAACLQGVQALLSAWPDGVNLRDPGGWAPVDIASYHRRSDIVALLQPTDLSTRLVTPRP